MILRIIADDIVYDPTTLRDGIEFLRDLEGLAIAPPYHPHRYPAGRRAGSSRASCAP